MGIIILNELDFRGLNVKNAYVSFMNGIRILKHLKKIRVECTENDKGAMLVEKLYIENQAKEYYKHVSNRIYIISGDLYYFASKDLRDNNGKNFNIKHVSIELDNVGYFGELYQHIKDNVDEYGITDFKDEL